MGVSVSVSVSVSVGVKGQNMEDGSQPTAKAYSSKRLGQHTELNAGSPGLSETGSTYWLTRRKAPFAGHSNTSIWDLCLNRATSEESGASTNWWYRIPVGMN
jgi:hypothetical protein